MYVLQCCTGMQLIALVCVHKVVGSDYQTTGMWGVGDCYQSARYLLQPLSDGKYLMRIVLCTCDCVCVCVC